MELVLGGQLVQYVVGTTLSMHSIAFRYEHSEPRET
jgi:hypothetical protein